MRVVGVGPDAVTPVEGNQQPRGFLASFDLLWPDGASIPEGFERVTEGNNRIGMTLPLKVRKASGRQKVTRQWVYGAETACYCMLLRALQMRSDAEKALNATTASRFTPPFRIQGVERAATIDAAETHHESGTRLTVTYTLRLGKGGDGELIELVEPARLSVERQNRLDVVREKRLLGKLETLGLDPDQRLFSPTPAICPLHLRSIGRRPVKLRPRTPA